MEVLSAESVSKNLKTRFVGQRVIYYHELTSTMDAAKQEAQQRAPEGTVVIAGRQTAGRGRLKRTWFSPDGSLALSVVLYPTPAQLPSLIMLASVAVVNAIKAVTGLEAQIKWPNDVLINRKKVCGILIENELRGNAVSYAVIGIGLNVNVTPSEFSELLLTATSLSGELGQVVSLVDFTRQLLIEIEKLYLRIKSGESIFDEWRDKLLTLGEQIRVKYDETVYEGIAESVAPDGSLMLRLADGTLIKIVAGDATMRN